MTTPVTTASVTTQPLSVPRAAWLVAEREITTQVRTKSFLISTAVTLLLVFGGILASSIFGGGPSTATVAVVSGAQVPDRPGLTRIQVADVAAGEELLRAGDADAVVAADTASPTGSVVIALSEAPSTVTSALAIQPEIRLLEPKPADDAIRSIVVIAFGLVFMMTVLGSGTMILQNTVQEKQSRVVEILLAAVPARALLAGKILGNTVIAVGTAVLLVVTAAVAMMVTGQSELLSLLTAPMLWFVVFFLFGFTLVAGLFAAAGSMVSRMEDSQSVMMPVMMLVMVPYFVVVFLSDNTLAMTIASYVPFSAPLAMPVRLFLGEAMWWEPVLSLVIIVATAALLAQVAGKIYSRSLLKMGASVKWTQALKGH